MGTVEYTHEASRVARPESPGPVHADNVEFRICIWAGVAMLVVFFAAMWPAANFFPPPSPSDGVAETARHYREHKDGVIAAGVLMLVAGTFFLAFGAALAEQIRRIAGRASLLARLQFAACIVNSVWFSMVGLLWITAAYRADRNPELVQVFHDMSWLTMIVPSSHIMLQVALAGVAILRDRRATPLLSRNLGYFCLLDSAFYVPAWAAGFTDHGVFAWDGLVSYWLSVVPFGVWTVVMIVALLKAAKRSTADLSLTPEARERANDV